jgi:hypothetical protein
MIILKLILLLNEQKKKNTMNTYRITRGGQIIRLPPTEPN